MLYFQITKIFFLSFASFILALAATPLLTDFLYKNKLGKQIRNDGSTPIFSELHKSKAGTPTMGGILVWGTAFFLIVLFWFLDSVLQVQIFRDLNFLSRKETLLPLGAFIGASLVGLLDDFLDVRQLGHKGRGLRFRVKIWLYALVALIGVYWFYDKLGFRAVHVPFIGIWHMGWWFIPFFLLAVIGTSFAVNQTDGLDGLAGGGLLFSFFAYGLIAFVQGKYDLASLLATVCGGLLAFLWFNVYPARFFMGDTGSMGMGTLLAIVAFLTNAPFLLLAIGFLFAMDTAASLLQMFTKKFFQKKIFLSTPLHHHFEAAGWPETKVTMRFWIISIVTSVIGLILYFIS